MLARLGLESDVGPVVIGDVVGDMLMSTCRYGRQALWLWNRLLTLLKMFLLEGRRSGSEKDITDFVLFLVEVPRKPFSPVWEGAFRLCIARAKTSRNPILFHLSYELERVFTAKGLIEGRKLGEQLLLQFSG